MTDASKTPSVTPLATKPATPPANPSANVDIPIDQSGLGEQEFAALKELLAKAPTGVVLRALSDALTQKSNEFYASDNSEDPVGRQQAASDLSIADRLRRVARLALG